MVIDLSRYYEPHEGGQRQVHESPAKRKFLRCGRRWGKGRTGLWEGLNLYADLLNDSPMKGLIPPIHFWLVVPTYRQGLQAWMEMKSLVPSSLIVRAMEETMILYLAPSKQRNFPIRDGLVAGGIWEIRSSEKPEMLQTVGLDYVWVSESQDVSEAAWNRLRPTLISAGRRGRLLCEGIPAETPAHWFERECRMARNGESPNSEYFNYNSFDNPLLTEEQKGEIYADKERMLERDWNRMYMAKMVGTTAPYFGDVRSRAIAPFLEGPEEGHAYVMGVDLGKRVDATVITVMDEREARVVYTREMRQTSWPVQEEAIVSTYKTWGCWGMELDTNAQGDPVYDHLVSRGIYVKPFVFSDQSRNRLLNQLAIGIEKGRLSYPPIVKLIDQLEACRPETLPSGRVVVRSEEHDDYVFSLALAFDMCSKSSYSGDWKPLAPIHKAPIPGDTDFDKGRATFTSRKLQAIRRQRKKERWDQKIRNNEDFYRETVTIVGGR